MDPGGQDKDDLQILVCDGDTKLDAEPDAGTVEIHDVSSGEWSVGVTRPPVGYHPAKQFSSGCTVSAGEETAVILTLVEGGPSTLGSEGQMADLTMPGCELVELYPGYPGYHGFVTGLDGIGDHACLQNLEAAYPTFDRAREDAVNVAAARRLGLNGQPQDWTWENWMAVEAERGLSPTCYSCAIAVAPNRPEPSGTSVRPDDPRLRIGDMWGNTAMFILASEHNFPPSVVNTTLPYDRNLRAIIGMLNPGRYLNAADMATAYSLAGDQLAAQGLFINSNVVLNNLIAQGGYAPTPGTAQPDDQVFMIMVGAEAAIRFLAPMLQEAYLQMFTGYAMQWRADLLDGHAPSFAEWLQQHAVEFGT